MKTRWWFSFIELDEQHAETNGVENSPCISNRWDRSLRRSSRAEKNCYREEHKFLPRRSSLRGSRWHWERAAWGYLRLLLSVLSQIQKQVADFIEANAGPAHVRVSRKFVPPCGKKSKITTPERLFCVRIDEEVKIVNLAGEIGSFVTNENNPNTPDHN